MKVRHPPGRAGRPWLAHRLAVARRGAELLDEKFRALMHERSRLEPEVAQVREDWTRSAREAELWLTRAALLGGERQLEAAAEVTAHAEVSVRWRMVLGVACPAETSVAAAAGAPPGGSAALLSAVEAHRRALEAAVRVAAGEAALRRVDAELLATRLRRNAIERNWIPAHEEALSALELTLEELEREDGTRLRRVTRAAREW